MAGSIRDAADCRVNDAACVLDALFPKRNRTGGDPITCRDVSRFFDTIDLYMPTSEWGRNADALFEGGRTNRTLQKCQTSCETGNFQGCRIVTPPEYEAPTASNMSNGQTGPKTAPTGRPDQGFVMSDDFVIEEVAMTSDAAADQDDKQRQDKRFVKSSGSYDFERTRKKRTPKPLSIQTAALYAVAGVGLAYLIRGQRKG